MAPRIAAFGIATIVGATTVLGCLPQSQPGGAAPGTPEANASVGESGWIAYRSELGGFALDIPVGWEAHETLEGDEIVVTFAPPGGGAGLVVRVHEPTDTGGSDLPNNRCAQIEIGGRQGLRCRDSVSGGDVTTVATTGRTYEIVSLAKRSGDVYEHILASFVILAAT